MTEGVDEVVAETRRGLLAAMRTLQAISRFVAARRAMSGPRQGIGGDLPRVAPPVIGAPAPAPDQDAGRLGELMDQHFRGWEQGPIVDPQQNQAQAADQFEQRWPQWQGGFGEVVNAVPENRVDEVFPSPADRVAFETSRAPAPAAENLYGSDHDDRLGAIDRGAAALQDGEMTGVHSESGQSVADILGRIQGEGGPAADSAQRVAERYGPLLDRLDGAEGEQADLLHRLAGGDEQRLPGTAGRPQPGSGEREGGKHRQGGPGVQKDGR